MKILVVSTLPTHPTSAGNRARILSVCRALRDAGHQLVFAFIPQEVGDFPATEKEFEGGFELMRQTISLPRLSILRRLIRKAKRMMGMASAYRSVLDDWYEPESGRWLAGLHERHRFDAVLVNYVFQSAVLKSLPSDLLKVIETHDVFGDRHLRYIEAGIEPEWYSTSRRDEDVGLSRADVVLAIQVEEGVDFRRRLHPTKKVVVVQPFMDEIPPAVRSDRPRAVVVASGNTINVIGVRWLIETVLPLVRKRLPDFELILAGDIGDRFQGIPGVVCLGRVTDLREAYEAGSLALNPVDFGTGFCIKTLEALAYGMPLVSTKTGCRGLESLVSTKSFVCVPDKDSEAMASAILDLLENADERERMAKAAWIVALEWSLRQKRSLAEAFGTNVAETEIER